MSEGITNSGRHIDFNMMLNEFHQIKDNLESMNIQLHPSCRFSLYERELEKAITVRDSNLPPSDIDWVLLTEGFKDGMELKEITSSKKIIQATRPFLTQVLSGALMPSEDANSMARDKQFELYLAAILERIGFEVRLEEPDIKFLHNSQEYSLAAKRIKSANKIRKRYREAIKQIKQFSNPGFIGISLDYLVRGEGDQIVTAGSPVALDEAGKHMMEYGIKDILAPAISSYDDEQVVGLITSLALPALLPYYCIGFISSLRAIYMAPEAEDICKRIGSYKFC